MPLITRSDLRLALTTGLLNGFAHLSGLAFGYYAPLAVLAVCSGTYGSSLELGRQRILGSLLGGALLLVGLRGLQGLPMPVGLAITLGALRLIGGALGLKVGYKVGGMITVMGWLVHDDQLGTWLPLRLFWTVVGILVALLSLRLLWPSRSRSSVLACLADLFAGLADDLALEAAALAPDSPSDASVVGATGAMATGAVGPLPAGPVTGVPAPASHAAAHSASSAGEHPAAPASVLPQEPTARLRARQATLQTLRGQRPALDRELGSQPLRHPLHRLVDTLETAASRLLSASRELADQPLSERGTEPFLAALQADQAELLAALSARLAQWSRQLASRGEPLPPPPATPLRLPPAWQALEERFSDPRLDRLPPELLERLAARFTLGRQLHEAIETAERSWGLLASGRGVA